MFRALGLAISQLPEPGFRRILWQSLGLALAVLIGLGILIYAILVHVTNLPWGWAEHLFELASGVGVALLTWLLFPATAGLVMSFILDRAAEAVEKRHYSGLEPARRQPFLEMIVVALRFAGIVIGLNILALPLYFVPLINLFVFYVLNGYLLGREYFELVALRRLDEASAKGLRQANQGRILVSGAIIAFLLTLPIVNLAAPLIATAFMVHLFESMRKTGSGPVARTSIQGT
jgi:CysZ protein